MEISSLFNNAVLAEAAYADLSNVTNEQTYIDALKANKKRGQIYLIKGNATLLFRLNGGQS